MNYLLHDFMALFDGNQWAIGTESGGCWRLDADPVAREREWEFRFQRHLEAGGVYAMGVYPMCDGEVHWGCVDFDEGEEESWEHAVNLTKVLSRFGIKGWIERSRSKGFHVWVFHRRHEWLPAHVVRRGLLVACQVAGAPTKEVNPKQEVLAPGKLGNYVRLPYPGALTADNHEHRRVVLTSDQQPISCSHFVKEAITAAGLDNLRQLAAGWKPPRSATEVREVVPVSEGEAAEVAEQLRRYTYRIWVEGPLEGSDRSGTLWQLCTRMEEEGISAQDALTLLRDADARWGKHFEERPNGLRYITKMVEKVYNVEFEES